jgi:hypothetical protein
MRKFLRLVALLAILAGVSYAAYFMQAIQPDVHVITAQTKSSHKLAFLSMNGRRIGGCTGTAIGPHAILTAEHCNEQDASEQMSIDLSTHIYNIVATCHDGRDHIIVLLDGPAFKNIDPMKFRAPKMGETLYLYGAGGGAYPPVFKTGKAYGRYDPSDVDANDKIFYGTIPIIPGDSGSAIYAEDGSIIGVVTYGYEREGDDMIELLKDQTQMAAFELAFTPEDIKKSQEFAGEK